MDLTTLPMTPDFMTNFAALGIQDSSLKALNKLGFEKPTSIQERAIPLLMERGHDFVGQAQTGTGKTAAFLLPLLEKIDFESNKMQALIIAPTRELALQVGRELEKLAAFTSLRTTTIYGGTAYEGQIKALKRDKVQVVVGTPGRLLDLMDRGNLQLQDCKTLIIDEADEMLNMGFLEDVESIINALPEEKQIWMFSATMPESIKKLVQRTFVQPKFIKSAQEKLTNQNISQHFCIVEKRDQVKALKRVMLAHGDDQAIVFCETREECKRVSDKMMDAGMSAMALHGDLSQSQREQAMDRFKGKKIQVLVCTDVAARGIDVNDLAFVFNMGFPRQDESYVHRIGRTGRAGVKGTAITFVNPNDRYRIKFIERKIGQALEPYDLPNINDIKLSKVKKDLERLTSLRDAVIERGEDFDIDDTYAFFREELKDCSKEQVLMTLFCHLYNKDFRLLQDSLQVSKAKPVRAGRLRKEDRGRRTRRSSEARGERRGRSGRSDRTERSDRGGRSSGGSERSGGAGRSRRTRRSKK